jgi:predicted DNA-binding protein (UPF0251 family)
MNEAKALLVEFNGEINSTVRYARKQCDIDPEDLRMHAVERLLTYAVEPGAFFGGVLTTTIEPDSHRKVQRALNMDMLNYIAADARQRGLDVSLDELPEDTEMPSTENMAERDSAMSDELEAGYPTLMLHFVSGMSQREIASELGIDRNVVRYRLDSEKAKFMKWALESGRVTEHDVVQVLFYGDDESLQKAVKTS